MILKYFVKCHLEGKRIQIENEKKPKSTPVGSKME